MDGKLLSKWLFDFQSREENAVVHAKPKFVQPDRYKSYSIVEYIDLYCSADTFHAAFIPGARDSNIPLSPWLSRYLRKTPNSILAPQNILLDSVSSTARQARSVRASQILKFVRVFLFGSWMSRDSNAFKIQRRSGANLSCPNFSLSLSVFI